ncbi:MAG: NADH-quinone oxidoreductase subunit A [Desulfurococcales archaeon]|nr:NADH-quinone oxidoreductase subunit A [Desulfurococcales archaeon]MCE4605565.1 NADH-quinone oxidoreductase subunit A [Desulfurococcales archaeon]
MPIDPGDPLVKSALTLVVLPLILTLALAGVIYFLRILTLQSRDVEEAEKYKYERFEAGNPPKGEARRKVSMQYLGYLIIFLAVEPAVILVALTLAAPRTMLSNLLYLYAVFIAVYTPLLVYALREARRVEAWTLT